MEAKRLRPPLLKKIKIKRVDSAESTRQTVDKKDILREA